ncbi:glutathione peroxidase [Sagittula stellata]|uniref:Glutathione peroxidase n=1 Tax=Sagittula stellata (strain ATCC 700073 / DSM 11524 / E-37) TaxID=388399 RepID=A3K0N8_SAGS3|nr:glutathione peroxidase [Sagittula stellata]EBA09353.1 glutathione peroxidase famly protein [Sagittula stellata E-37]
MIRTATLLLSLLATPLLAAGFTFNGIDGGTLDLGDWKGQPVLVVNTASRCGFTPQYDGLQSLYDRHKEDGLVVLAVPSDDFRQELATAEEVADFCAVNFGLTLPMTDITSVRGATAHPFYQWVKQQYGFEPSWNFNKVLVSPEGEVVATFGSTTKPLSEPIVSAIQPYLK